MNTKTIEKWDQVSLDGKKGQGFQGTVVQDGASRSLVEFSASPESGASYEREWIENSRLYVRARRRSKLIGDEPPIIRIIEI